MKQKRKLKLSLFLGLLLGISAGSFLFFQGKLLVWYLKDLGEVQNGWWIQLLFGVAAVVLGGWITKKFVSMRKKRLTMYFIASVLGSVLFMIFVMGNLMSLVSNLYQNRTITQFFDSKAGTLVLLDLGCLYVLLMIVCFVGFFVVLVNRKVKYIEYISEEVKKIETEGFGRTMELRGNDELADLSKGINTMSTTLKEKMDREKQLEKNKNELITNVSHDLRTPLTSIMGYVALMKQNGFEDKEKCEEYLDVVDRRLQGLNTLINELFEYTRLDSSEFRLNTSKVEIIEILNHLIREYAITYQKTGLKMDAQMDLASCKITVDVEKIIRVIQNLLDNARKYATKGSMVQVHVDQREQWLRIQITNATDQLRAEEMNQIFERFYKGDTARSKSDSFGLGLAIVKRIVELHEGTVQGELKNNLVCFTVELPIA